MISPINHVDFQTKSLSSLVLVKRSRSFTAGARLACKIWKFNLIKFMKNCHNVSLGCTDTWRGPGRTLSVAKSSIHNNNISSQTLSGHQVHSNYQWLKNDLLRRLGVRDQDRAQRRDTPLSCMMSFVNWSRFFLKRKRFIICISHAPPGKAELSGNIKLSWDWK